ncbi:MAG: TIGR00730 family Rossman fold protein [Alphaproteobacteria bacterium]
MASKKQATAPAAAARVPQPADPRERREPLPWQRPKPSEDDPSAPERIAAIIASPSYRQADQDVEFLGRDESRGLRLQLEYLKAELLLEDHRIDRTVVVFGSTRISEPAAARRRVAALRAKLSLVPGDKELASQLAVAERILAKSHYYEVARELSRLVAASGPQGKRGELVVMTGGGPGIMEAANRGARDAGAQSVGLNITLPHDQYPNPYVTPDLCFRFHYFALRKLHFVLRAWALVAFPGGYGTLDELFEVLTLVQTRKIRPLPVVLVGEAFWRKAFDPDFLVAEGVIDPEDRELFWFAESAAEIWSGIQRWHERIGLSLSQAAEDGAR